MSFDIFLASLFAEREGFEWRSHHRGSTAVKRSLARIDATEITPKVRTALPLQSWRAKRVILCIYELWSLLRRLIKAQKKSDRITLSLQLWRKGRDSNPRYSCPYTAFRVRPDRPLRHLSFEKRCKDMYFFVKLYHLDAKKCKKVCIL